MTLHSNLPEFERAAIATAIGLRLEIQERLTRLGAFGYERLIQNTEDVGAVDTGAYRAEHVIEADGAPIYENPDRVGPEARFPSQKRMGLGPRFRGPTWSDVVNSLASVDLSRGFGFVNRRYYAAFLEYGTSRIEPRQIYAAASDATQAFAQSLALEPAMRPELRP